MRSRLILSFAALSLTLPLAAQTDGPFEITSLLGKKLYAQPTDTSVTAAQAKLAGSPTPADYLAYSKAEAAAANTRKP